MVKPPRTNLVGGLLTIDMCCCAVYYLDRHLTLENLGCTCLIARVIYHVSCLSYNDAVLMS